MVDNKFRNRSCARGERRHAASKPAKWACGRLRGIVGDETFWAGIRSYYRAHQDGHATTADFRGEMERASVAAEFVEGGAALRPVPCAFAVVSRLVIALVSLSSRPTGISAMMLAC